MRRLLLIAALLLTGPVSADERLRQQIGYAYDLKTGALQYTELHQEVYRHGRLARSEVSYRALDGSPLGSKSVDYLADRLIPSFRTEMIRAGTVEATRLDGARIDMLRIRGVGKPEERSTVRREGLMTADAGFHCLIQDWLPALLAGETVNFRVAAAVRLDTYRFQVRKVGDTVVAGRKAVILKAELASWLRYLAPDLTLIYDPATGDLLEFSGISNVIDPATDDNYRVRIVYQERPADGFSANLHPPSH